MKSIIIGLLLAATMLLTACNVTTTPDATAVTNFEECVKAGHPVMESYPRQCNDGQQTFTEVLDEPIIGGDTDEHGCLGPAGYQWCPSTGQCQRMWEEYCEEFKEQYREPVACTMEYAPVCGTIQIQCVTTPCDPLEETFGNRCMAEAAGAVNIVEGECAG